VNVKRKGDAGGFLLHERGGKKEEREFQALPLHLHGLLLSHHFTGGEGGGSGILTLGGERV